MSFRLNGVQVCVIFCIIALIEAALTYAPNLAVRVNLGLAVFFMCMSFWMKDE